MKEIALKIRLFGDRALRKRSQLVKGISEAHRDTLGRMAEMMYVSSGIGLAAPQVGINECMIVVDIGAGLYKLINPKITKKEGTQILEEGCLSIPGVCIKVKRAKRVLIKAQDEFAQPLDLQAEDLLACVFQHEIDHLRGRLIVDYASFWQKLRIRKKLEELKKRAKGEDLSESKTESCQLQL